MKIGFIRLLDRRFGPPICFLLTVWHQVVRLIGFGKPDPARLPRKILFIKLSEIGAVICAYPLLRRIRTEYPEAELFFLTFAPNREVFALLGGVIAPDHVLTVRINSFGLFIKDTLGVLRFFAGNKIDAAFDLEFFSKFTAILTYLSGAPKRVGFYKYTFEGLYRGELLTHRVQYNPLLHISGSYYSMGQSLKAAQKMSPEMEAKVPQEAMALPVYAPDEAVVRRMKDVLSRAGVTLGQKILLLHTGEGLLSLREWPHEYYLELVGRIIKETDIFMVFIGAESDDNSIERIMQLGAGRCLNLNGRTSLPELLALFHVSDAVFANDCGLVHLAALSDIKKFIVFGPESPGIFAPPGNKTWVLYSGLPCSPCFSAFNHRTSACRDNNCVKSVSPDQVYRLITQNL